MEDVGDTLIDQGIGGSEDLYPMTTPLLKLTCKSLRESNPPVTNNLMEEYKLYTLCIWYCHISMRNLATDLGNFQVGNTNTYIMAHHNIQDCNYWYEESIVKIPYPLGKSNKFRRFVKMFQNWIIIQFSMY